MARTQSDSQHTNRHDWRPGGDRRSGRADLFEALALMLEELLTTFPVDQATLHLTHIEAGSFAMSATRSVKAVRPLVRPSSAPLTGLAAQAISTGRLQLANDAALNPFSAPHVSAGLRSQACMPLAKDGHVLGVIDLASGQPNIFTPEMLPALRALADDATQVIDQAILCGHAQDWGEKLEALLESSDDGIIMTDPDQVIKVVNRRAGLLLGLDPGVLLGEKAPGPLAAALRTRAADPPQIDRLLAGIYARENRTVKEEIHLIRPVEATLSLFTTPVLARNGDVTGRLIAINDISRERLFRAKLQAAAEAAMALTSSPDLDTVLRSLSKAIGKHVTFDRLSVATIDQESKTFQPLAIIGPLDRAFSDRGPSPLAGTRIGRVVTAKAPLLTGDLREMPDQFPEDGVLIENGLRSILIMPLVLGEDCVGTFNLGNAQPGAFDEATLEFLTPIVDNLAVAVSNVLLTKQAEARAEQNAALNRIIRAATSSTSLESYLPQLAAAYGSVIPFDHLSLVLTNDTGNLEAVAIEPGEAEDPSPRHTVRIYQASGPDDEGGLAGAVWGTQACACLSVPLEFRGQCLGSLNLARAADRPFSAAEVEFTERAAAQVAGILENIRLYVEVREEADVSSALLEVAQKVARRADIRDIFATAADCFVKVLGYDEMVACVLEPSQSGPRLTLKATRHDQDLLLDEMERTVELDKNVADFARLAGSEDVLPVDDTAKFPNIGRCLEAEFGVRSAIIGVMRSGAEYFGTLLVGYAAPAKLSKKHEQLVKGLAGLLATAIQEGRLTRRLERNVSQLTAISRASHHLTAILELPTLLSEVVVFLTRDLGYDFSGVFLYDREAEELKLSAQAGALAADVPAGYTQSANLGMAGWVARNGQPLVANRVDEEPAYASVAGLPTKARMCLPLKVGDEVLGVLDLESQTPGVFIDDEVTAISTLSRQLAIAIHNANVFRRERDLYMAAVKTLAEAVDARDHHTRAHSSRVSRYARMIAKAMGLPAETLPTIEYAGLLHDIGKIGLDDVVLKKKGILDPLERAQMMEHPTKGANILQQVAPFRDIVPLVKHHHEWWAGGGYPDGVAGEAIPLGSRILAVADAFDAMTTNRPYRLGLDPEEAFTRLQAGRGTQFDPAVVDSFVTHLKKLKDDRDPIYVGLERRDSGSVEGGPPMPQTTIGRILPVHGKELGILYQISLETRSLLNLSHLMHRILSILYDAMGAHSYTLFLLDEATGDLVSKAVVGLSPTAEPSRIPKGRGITGWVAEYGLPQVVGDVRSDARYSPPPNVTMLSELAVPLVAEGHTIGVLDIESDQLNAFSRDDLYLVSAVAGQISIAIEVARYHEQVAHAAIHDGLTGTHNHSYFYRRLDEEISRAVHDEVPLALLLIDVDSLKLINDVYGHLAGDRALVALAKTLDESFRPTDTIARYGGDEFAVILPRTGALEARQAAERLSTSVGQHSIDIDGRQFTLPGVTVGVAVYPDDGARPTELVARADERMYQCKQAKRCPEVAKR